MAGIFEKGELDLFPRKLTSEEESWLKYALSLLPPEKSKHYLEQVLVVFAIVHTNTEDGRELIVHEDTEGKLAVLEVI